MVGCLNGAPPAHLFRRSSNTCEAAAAAVRFFCSAPLARGRQQGGAEKKTKQTKTSTQSTFCVATCCRLSSCCSAAKWLGLPLSTHKETFLLATMQCCATLAPQQVDRRARVMNCARATTARLGRRRRRLRRGSLSIVRLQVAKSGQAPSQAVVAAQQRASGSRRLAGKFPRILLPTKRRTLSLNAGSWRGSERRTHNWAVQSSGTYKKSKVD